MTRDEVVERLQHNRIRFDQRVARIPRESLDVRPEGRAHTPKQVVAHVTEYEALVIERLRAARVGDTTALFRDRVGWEEFNEQVWSESEELDIETVLDRSEAVFADLIGELMMLSDADMIEDTGVIANIDPAWLQGRTFAQVVAVDCFDHYPMHYEELEQAAGQSSQ